VQDVGEFGGVLARWQSYPCGKVTRGVRYTLAVFVESFRTYAHPLSIVETTEALPSTPSPPTSDLPLTPSQERIAPAFEAKTDS
jgi:hypothetical protein